MDQTVVRSPDSLDFSSLSHEEITHLLQRYQLSFTVDEALAIQQDVFKRPPTVAECFLWSALISAVCQPSGVGRVVIATDYQGCRYGLVVGQASQSEVLSSWHRGAAANVVAESVGQVSSTGADVMAVAEALRFGKMDGQVIREMSDYSNRLGVPLMAGDVSVDPARHDQCLMSALTLGIVREDHRIASSVPAKVGEGVLILVGRSIDHASEATVPNALLQRYLLKANDALFKRLREQHALDKVGFKGVAAGGVGVATIELAASSGGAEIDLGLVPISDQGMAPALRLCAETPERFLWVVPPSLVDTVLIHYNDTFALPRVSPGVRAAVIGHLRADDRYVVTYQGKAVVHVQAEEVLIHAATITSRASVAISHADTVSVTHHDSDPADTLLTLLAHDNIASRAPIFEQYDKQVQGRTVMEAGLADAGVMQPFNDDSYPEEIRNTGVALSLSQPLCHEQGSAYWEAVDTVARSVRQVVAVGAVPSAMIMAVPRGVSAEAVKGMADACHVMGLSVISNHESSSDQSFLMSGCLGVLRDVNKVITSDLKRSDSALLVTGVHHHDAAATLNIAVQANEWQAVRAAMEQGMILAAKVIAVGGVAVTLAEMSFKNKIGIQVDLPGELPMAAKLFNEAGGFVLEVPRHKLAALTAIFQEQQVPLCLIGDTSKLPRLIYGNVMDIPISDAKVAWEQGLRKRVLV